MAAVDGGVHATAAQHPVVLGDEQLRAPVDRRIARPVKLGERPVRRGAPAIQQAGLGQVNRAGTDAGHPDAFFVTRPQPRQQRGVSLKLHVEIQSGGPSHHHVGMACGPEGTMRTDPELVAGLDRLPVDRGHLDVEARCLWQAVKYLPEDAGGAEYLDRAEGGRAQVVAGQHNDHLDDLPAWRRAGRLRALSYGPSCGR
jgi:hypothetical protein